MTSAEIRQSFLDFFKSKGHTLVPSSSLMPDSPNLLFTNAGMNQFVPIFLGQRAPDVSKWAGAVPGSDTRAADTQKCIRAGGKHNDLEDVGLDTYHHTFFEMLGNWSFGDYFKREAITWAWDLVTEVWKFPKNRLYATVYAPDKSKGDPSEFDQEAYDIWAEKFRAAGLDPKVHIVNGNKKDNFWMMGDTGPCGPCSELHVDLTPQGDTKGRLVNQGTAECIEIWNLVFIQFNANPDGTFSPLPARHVDTGMGFERVTGIMQNTRGFTDFNRVISNYETDIFRPLFDQLEKLSGRKYASTLPAAGTPPKTEQEKIDVAFRVIADHIRTLSFAIADGIQPGNTDRNYVLRRILRRAVRYGRTLGFREPFFYKLVAVLADTMGHVFPELGAKQEHIEEVIQREEEAFNRTLDKGIRLFNARAELGLNFSDDIKNFENFRKTLRATFPNLSSIPERDEQKLVALLTNYLHQGRKAPEIWEQVASTEEIMFVMALNKARDMILRVSGRPPEFTIDQGIIEEITRRSAVIPRQPTIPGWFAFKLYDEQGFPLDLTELMARERGLTVDVAGFNHLMEEQKARARAAQKKAVIEVASHDFPPTKFIGFDSLQVESNLLGFITKSNGLDRVPDYYAATDVTPFYAELGGQVGDTGELHWTQADRSFRVTNTLRVGDVHYLKLDPEVPFGLEQLGMLNVAVSGELAKLSVNKERRLAIQRHHTVTHLLHWALHEVVSKDATQKGSYVGPDKLTFDFSSAALTPQQVADVERLVNERILENAPVAWTEVKYNDIRSHPEIMQFFGEKYGDVVRVVQIGGQPAALNGYSMELCGGTHTRATGEIGLFRIVAESAIAAGIRRIEAVSGLEAYRHANAESHLIKTLSGKVNSPVGELEKKLESMLAQQKELEKQLKALRQKEAADLARSLTAKAQAFSATHAIIDNLGSGDGDFLQAVADGLKGQFKGVVVLGSSANGAVALVATVSPEFTKQFQAGKLIQAIAPIVGGKGGGRPDNARGGGKEVDQLDAALAKAKSLLGGQT